MADNGGLHNIRQLCICVRDFEKTVKRFEAVLGIQFHSFTVDASEIPGFVYCGKQATYSIWVGKALVGGWELEVISPLKGRSFYDEFLDKHGDGLHHVGIFVKDFAAAEKRLLQNGFKSVLKGPIAAPQLTGSFEYFEQDPGLGIILELLDDPAAPAGFVDEGAAQ